MQAAHAAHAARKRAWLAGLFLVLGGCGGRAAEAFTVRLSADTTLLVTPDAEKLAEIIGYDPEGFEEDVRRAISQAAKQGPVTDVAAVDFYTLRLRTMDGVHRANHFEIGDYAEIRSVDD